MILVLKHMKWIQLFLQLQYKNDFIAIQKMGEKTPIGENTLAMLVELSSKLNCLVIALCITLLSFCFPFSL